MCTIQARPQRSQEWGLFTEREGLIKCTWGDTLLKFSGPSPLRGYLS